MKIVVEPGRYVVAVSGGVDSVVLLDLLRSIPKLELTVAHFDHGIRSDSRQDRLFVQELAAAYGLPFVYSEGQLGENASEALARQARYKFLNSVRQEKNADAVVTAHHQDDMIETAIINIMRGTGRHGLTSLRSGASLKRPLLQLEKSQLVRYAKLHELEWREDSTNQEEKYLRNYIRHNIVPKMTPAARQQLLAIIEGTSKLNDTIDQLIVQAFPAEIAYNKLDRGWFISLPHSVAKDILVLWLRSAGLSNITQRRIEQVVVAAKTLSPGKRVDLSATHYIRVNRKDLALVTRDR